MSIADNDPASETPPGEGSERPDDATVTIPAPTRPDGASAQTGDDSSFDLAEASAELQELGRYSVVGVVGSGGMGHVLEAFDQKLDRPVAIKILHRQLDHEYTQRLIREARALAQLSHPHVVQVYEVARVGERAYIVMELVPGQPLRAWMKQTPRPRWSECVHLFIQAGEGLAAAHARGLVHRDFKPGNAIVDDDGRVRVLDFGLARLHHEPVRESTRPVWHESGDEARLTRTGTVQGTPAYMPPEQMRGDEADAKSDQYSFCISLYEAIYGERPFEGVRIEEGRLLPPSGKVKPVPPGIDCPAPLRAALLRGFGADAAQRWPSMDALLGELRRVVRGRGRRWPAAALATGVAVVGAVAWWPSEGSVQCDASAQLAGVWDAARKREVEAAFENTDASYRAQTWARVEVVLDDYAEQWREQYQQTCEATHRHDTQAGDVMDLRMACLRERRGALEASVDLLAAMTEGRLSKSVQMVTRLPRIDRCADLEALAAELPPPEDPEVAAEVEAQRARLKQSKSLEDLGEYEQGLALTRDVLTKAEALSYPPLVAEAKVRVGWFMFRLGDAEQADKTVEAGYLLAVELGHRRVERDAARVLTTVVGNGLARHESGLKWGKTALTFADDPESRGRAHNSMGMLLHVKGDREAALEHFQQGLEATRQTRGERHPSVAVSLNNIGLLRQEQGELTEALEHYQLAREIWSETLGDKHPGTAASLHNIAVVYFLRGELDEALEYAQQAVDVKEEVLGPDHPDVTMSLNAKGEILRSLGHPERALVPLRRALKAAEKRHGPDHPSVAHSLVNIAPALRDLGRLQESLEHHQRALAIYSEAFGPRHPRCAHTLLSLSEIALLQDRPDDARGYAEQGLSIREEAQSSPMELAASRFRVAQALWSDPDASPSDRSRARSLAQQAREVFVDQGKAARKRVEEVDQWLEEQAPSSP
ncbi:MAG: serine/threonine-protein kinase [Myxococcota bacterium]